ncbi:hypothetical protein EYC80_005572 [Monilinia laxa]|uniref:Uncharacterized protein n=1 Tax=Monilinia laxa TaxID=61186 RepID=A0A5N6KER5_MONLA|nr:hypothetical protein EYC80_005572 [Monilinia laxa]
MYKELKLGSRSRVDSPVEMVKCDRPVGRKIYWVSIQSIQKIHLSQTLSYCQSGAQTLSNSTNVLMWATSNINYPDFIQHPQILFSHS